MLQSASTKLDLRLPVVEIYPAIQGEGRFAGSPCTIVRLGGCNLRCSWCDTTHAYSQNNKTEISSIINEVNALKKNYVLLTGGEPLLHGEIISLMNEMKNRAGQIMLETNGSISVENVPAHVHITMDIKCPGSWHSGDPNLYENIQRLKPTDEIKFVVQSKSDFDWAVNVCQTYGIFERFDISPIIQPVFGVMKEETLSTYILESNWNFRLGLQLHKYIYSPDRKKV